MSEDQTPETFVGRRYKVTGNRQTRQAFPRDFKIIGETGYCYLIENDVERYPISKTAFDTAASCGHLEEVKAEDA